MNATFAAPEDVGKPQNLAFVSYSHKDADWPDRLSTFLKPHTKHLKPYTKQGRLNVWADPYIQVGDQWRRNISAAPGQAKLGAFTIRIGGNA